MTDPNPDTKSSVIQSLKQLYTTNQTVKNIKEELYQANQENKIIHFIGVPSHIEITGNEKADRHVREAIRNPDFDTLSIPSTDSNCYSKRVVLTSLWQRNWDQLPSKLKKDKPTVKPFPIPKNRQYQIMITRLRIGHCKLIHEHLLKKQQQPRCDDCNTNWTLQHVLCECPKFHQVRGPNNISESVEQSLGKDCNIENVVKFFSDASFLRKF